MDTSSKNTICMNIAWRDREWILPYVMEGIYNLDYPKEKIGFRFIVNDSADNSFRKLMQFKRQYGKEYRFISVWTMNMGSVKDKRNVDTRRKTVWVMQILKNIFMDASSKRDEYFMFMDSDIILEKDTLKKLVGADKDIIAALCNNGPLGSEGIYNFLSYNSHLNRFDRNMDWGAVVNSYEPVKVDLIAGIFLMRHWLTKKIRFYQAYKNTFSEDEGATRDLMRLGIERWIHPDAFVHHIMSGEHLTDYINKTGDKGLDLNSKWVDTRLDDEGNWDIMEEAVGER